MTDLYVNSTNMTYGPFSPDVSLTRHLTQFDLDQYLKTEYIILWQDEWEPGFSTIFTKMKSVCLIDKEGFPNGSTLEEKVLIVAESPLKSSAPLGTDAVQSH